MQSDWLAAAPLPSDQSPAGTAEEYNVKKPLGSAVGERQDNEAPGMVDDDERLRVRHWSNSRSCLSRPDQATNCEDFRSRVRDRVRARCNGQMGPARRVVCRSRREQGSAGRDARKPAASSKQQAASSRAVLVVSRVSFPSWQYLPSYSIARPSAGIQMSPETSASHGVRMRPVYIGQVVWWSQCGRILRGRMWIHQERVDENGL